MCVAPPIMGGAFRYGLACILHGLTCVPGLYAGGYIGGVGGIDVFACDFALQRQEDRKIRLDND